MAYDIKAPSVLYSLGFLEAIRLADISRYLLTNSGQYWQTIIYQLAKAPMAKTTAVPQRGRRLGKQAWIFAARDALIAGGLEAVKIERIAKTLKATRAAFYWHFTDRDDLLEQLLSYWKVASTESYEDIISRDIKDGEVEFELIHDLWRDDKDFYPAFDNAMRDWARVSKKVAKAVSAVDNKRIEILHQIFIDLDYEEPEAFVRARIAYFQQIGYYTLGIKESRKRRLELAPVYMRILMGH